MVHHLLARLRRRHHRVGTSDLRILAGFEGPPNIPDHDFIGTDDDGICYIYRHKYNSELNVPDLVAEGQTLHNQLEQYYQRAPDHIYEYFPSAQELGQAGGLRERGVVRLESQRAARRRRGDPWVSEMEPQHGQRLFRRTSVLVVKLAWSGWRWLSARSHKGGTDQSS